MKHLITLVCLLSAGLALNSCMQSSVGSDGGETGGIYGTLTDAQGAPVADALVRVYPDTGTGVVLAKVASDTGLHADSIQTDAYGRFAFPKLKNGHYNLECTVKKTGDTQAVFIPGIRLDSNCNLGKNNLHPPGSISIRVQSEAGASLSDASCDIPGSPFSAISDSSGKCLLLGVPPGTFRVRLQHDGFLPALSASLEVQSGKTTDGGVVILSPIPSSGLHFPIHSSTVALWTFNAKNNGQFIDSTSHHFVLSGSSGYTMQSSPYDSAIAFNGTGGILQLPNNSAFTVAPTGKITFEARIYLDQYSSDLNYKGGAEIMGMYEGLNMGIGSDGSLSAGAQKTNASVGDYWYKAGQSDAGVIPLHRWVDVAIAADQSVFPNQLYAYIDGQPVQLYGVANSDSFRISTSTFTVGNSDVNDVPLQGKIDEIRISNSLVLGPGLPLTAISPVDSISHFGVNSSTVALWTFNSQHGDLFSDLGPNHILLVSTNGNNGISIESLLEPSPYGSSITFNSQVVPLMAALSQTFVSSTSASPVIPGSASNIPVLTVAGTGKITLEARVYLSQYASTGNSNKASLIMGTYEGPHMFVYSDGTLMGGGQKLDSTGTGYWYGPYSDSAVVPLNRWVDLAVALDQTTGQTYGYIDGKPVQLYTGPDHTIPDTRPWRISTSPFMIGNSNVDNNPFTGKIDEIRVSNSLILGTGLPVAFTARSLP